MYHLWQETHVLTGIIFSINLVQIFECGLLYQVLKINSKLKSKKKIKKLKY